MDFLKRLIRLPRQSFFLFGPRGTGKSTLLQSEFGNALWIDLLKPDIYRRFLGNPERLIDVILGGAATCVVIDEIQKIPALLTVVHSLIEERKQLQFVLTGSSARKLKRSGADLLAGRAVKRVMHPFIAPELKDLFSLEKALNIGLIPLIFQSTEPLDALHAYINLYLQEEIQAEGLVRNLDDFSRFLEIISFSHGCQLNVANIARECEVKRKTVENYITILKDLLLAYEVPVFTKRARRELSAHPKFYLFDTGVYRALRPKGPLDSADEIEGVALEGLVAQHLKSWLDYLVEPHQLYFWRTRSNVEIDFVVYGPKHFLAIEVKNSAKVSTKDTRSLESFLVDYPEAKALLLYRGYEQIKLKNVLCLPCSKFLMELESFLSF